METDYSRTLNEDVTDEQRDRVCPRLDP